MKEYVSPVDIMNGRVSPIIMNFNERFNIMKGVWYTSHRIHECEVYKYTTVNIAQHVMCICA